MYDMDKAITLTAYGSFHYKIMASSAFCLLSSGLQNGLSAYLLPAARCELLLSSPDVGFINSAFLIGGTCSAFIWGMVADINGRKKILVVTLLLDSVVTVCTAFVQDFFGFVVCRFISGFLMGAPGCITYTYLAEFHAPHHRSKSVYYSGIFYTFSWLVLPVLARAILPLHIDVRIGSFAFCCSWRTFLMAIALPEIIAGVWLITLPETPKFLGIQNPKKALNVLKEMYSANTGNNKNDFPVKKISDLTSTGEIISISGRGKILRMLQGVRFQMKTLLKPPLLFTTILICTVMFSNMFGYFGLGLWLPQLLKKYQTDTFFQNDTVLLNMTGINDCQVDFKGLLFTSTIVIGVCTILANFVSGWLGGKFTPKIIPLFTMISGGVSVLAFFWLNATYQNLIAASVFQSTMSVANVAVGSVIMELFPTRVSAIAMSTSIFAGRVGAMTCNIIFGILIEKHLEIAIFLVSGILLCGGALCLMIPDKINMSLKNTICEGSNAVKLPVITTT